MYIALENIRSLYNVGAMLRTCSFFGIKKVFLVGYSGKQILPGGKVQLHEKLQKTGLGSQNDVQIIFLENSQKLLDLTQTEKITITAVEQSKNSISLESWKPTKNCILVFGNEVDGVSQLVLQNSSEVVQINRPGLHNSLNVATTCGIVLYKVNLLRSIG